MSQANRRRKHQIEVGRVTIQWEGNHKGGSLLVDGVFQTNVGLHGRKLADRVKSATQTAAAKNAKLGES